MIWLLTTLLYVIPSITGVVIIVAFTQQKKLDHNRKTYIVTFPSDLAEDRVLAWLRSISGTLHTSIFSRLVGVPSIAFETWADDRSITHRLKVPWQEADYIIAQMRSLIPGISIAPDKSRPAPKWSHAVEIGMSDPLQLLRINNAKDSSASLLASVQALNTGERVMLQWVLTPAVPETPPAKTKENGQAVDDVRKKLEQPNLLAVGRIGSVAETKPRAVHLVDRVEKSLASLNSARTRFVREGALLGNVADKVQQASSPFLFPAQLSLPELAAVLAWPIGQPFVAGLPQGASRHLFASEDIPREGRVLGHSNFPGHERPIALSFHRASEHMYYGGGIGSGKSTGMANCAAQDMEAGHGVVVIDAGNSESGEALFYRVLDLVPRHRLDDVIVIDVNKDRFNPVGFNVLDQGNARQVVDQITELIGHMYKDTSGVWMREILFHGLYTLAEHGGYTLMDLPRLIQPKTQEESAWADQLVRGVKDPELKDFWIRWDNYSTRDRAAHAEPLLNKIWQLVARSEIRNIIGQTKSSFQWSDVLKENKIVLISLVGLPKDTASILGTLFVNAIWTAAQTMTPEKANFLYMDEFQLMTRLPMNLDEMLRLARKHKLGAVLGTQYIDDLSQDMKSAIINAVRTRVIFSTSSKEARMWQNEFGRQVVDEADFMNLARYEGIAQISTDVRTSRPVTLRALAPLKPTGMTSAVIAASRKKYGRPLSEVEKEITERRAATPTPKKQRPNIGRKGWDE